MSWVSQPQTSARRPLPRYFGLPLIAWLSMLVVAVTVAGGIYSVWLARTSPPAPALPSGPPHATMLSHANSVDMLQGNFITTNALYRSTDTPAQVIAFYRKLLAHQTPQFGHFAQLAYTTAPSETPAAALQYIPPIFASPTDADSHAALYVYTEYSKGDSDTAIAIDMRHPHGPTLVYMEMLTQPGTAGF
jgi:hypothetical protein